MDITQLMYFLQLCEDGSFSKSSQRLYISQQGLSMSILRLEKELGEKLFVRTPKGLVLTKSGEFLLPRAENIIKQVEECETYFQLESKRKKIISVGSVYNVIGRLPASLQEIFCQNSPNYEIQVTENTSIEVEKMVEKGDCTFGFCLGPIESQDLESHFLFQREYCFIVNKEHPLAEHKTISIKELKDEKLLVMNRRFKINSILQKLCRQAGFEPNYVFESDRLEIFYDMVRNNPTLMAHSLDCYAESNKDDRICNLYLNDCELYWDVYLVHAKNRKLSKAEEYFKQKVLEVFAEDNEMQMQK